MRHFEAGTTLYANEVILDRLIVDTEGQHAGMVDDLELTEVDDEGPEWTAILCGSVALGPRIGGRLGVWWLSIGRRLRPGDSIDPVRIPLGAVEEIDSREIRLGLKRTEIEGAGNLRDWVQQKLIARIPGNGS